MKKIFNKEKILKLFTNKKFIILFLLVIFSLIILSIFPCNLARLIFDVYFVIATLIMHLNAVQPCMDLKKGKQKLK